MSDGLVKSVVNKVWGSPQVVAAAQRVLKDARGSEETDLAIVGEVLKWALGQDVLQGAGIEVSRASENLVRAKLGLLKQDEILPRLKDIKSGVEKFISELVKLTQGRTLQESSTVEDETFDAVDDQDTVWLDDIYYIMTGKAGSPQKVTASEMKKLVALKDLTEILISLQAQQPGTVLDLKTIRTINPGAFHNLEDPEIEGIISRLKEVSGLQKLEEALIGSAF